MKSPIKQLTHLFGKRGKKEAEARRPERPYPLPLLTAGFYTIGVDFPSGRASLTAINGNGFFSYKGETTRLGIEEPAFYKRKLEDVILTQGERFMIWGTLILKAHFMTPFEIPSGRRERVEEIRLAPGAYRCGSDFNPGDYTIRVLSGHGHINVKGARSPWDCYLGDHDKKRIWYIPEVKHVPLREGVLHISSTLSVLLLKETEQESQP